MKQEQLRPTTRATYPPACSLSPTNFSTIHGLMAWYIGYCGKPEKTCRSKNGQAKRGIKGLSTRAQPEKSIQRSKIQSRRLLSPASVSDHVLKASMLTGFDADPTPVPSTGTTAPVPSLGTSEYPCIIWSSKGPEVALISVPPFVAGWVLVVVVAVGTVGLTAPVLELSALRDG